MSSFSFRFYQKIITFASRVIFFAIIFPTLCFSSLPPIFNLDKNFIAFLVALAIVIPVERATSLWFMAVSHLSLFCTVYLVLHVFFADKLWFGYATVFGFAPFIICALFLMLGLFLAKKIRVKKYSVGSGTKGEHIKVVQLTDMHPSRFFSLSTVRCIFSLVQKQNADIIVMTGDIFDENTSPDMFDKYCALFSEIVPKYGIYYVFGNHDAHWLWKKPAHSREDIVNSLKSANVRVLEDESATVFGGKVRIIGRRDVLDERKTPAELLAPYKNEDTYKILLCHEPIGLDECAKNGADLTMCGHTHGGQIFPVGILSSLFGINEMRYGIRNYPDSRCVIVSSGVGTWKYPIRTESRSEIVVVDVNL